MTPIRRVDRVDSVRPASLGTYWSASAARRTFSRVAAETRESSRRARETVGCDTPASRATS